MNKLAAALALLAIVPAGALAQRLPPGVAAPPGGFVILDRNNTGGEVNVTIPRGPYCEKGQGSNFDENKSPPHVVGCNNYPC